MGRTIAVLLCVLAISGSRLTSEAAPLLASGAEAPPKVTWSQPFEFEPAPNEAGLPKQFQLGAHMAEYRVKPLSTVSETFTVAEVTFSSPVVTDEEANNTVHCEYFQPVAAGPHPGVIVLHILGGDFDLARLFARGLADQGVAALFVKMPYYGPRRTPGSSARMVSIDPEATVRGMTQAVLDVRQATAWLAEREEVDEQRLGIMGISLGGITAALSAAAEPRLQNVCLILAGGDVGQVAWQSRHLAKLRETWTAKGGTHESFLKLFATIDPVTYAKNVQGRRILMLNAEHDEVIPRACTQSLWRALGQPEIIWWDATHFTAARYMFEGLSTTTRFFRDSPVPMAPAGK